MDINSAKRIDKKSLHDYDALLQLLTSTPHHGDTNGQEEGNRKRTNETAAAGGDTMTTANGNNNNTDTNNLNENEAAETKPKEATKPPKELPTRPAKWRHMPDLDFEDLIILSYGDEFPPSLCVANKAHDNTVDDKDLPMLARKEFDIIQEKLANDNGAILKYIYTDFPRAQFSKEYYLDRVKQFLIDNKTGGGRET